MDIDMVSVEKTETDPEMPGLGVRFGSGLIDFFGYFLTINRQKNI